jgi:hypothetical protein
MKVMVLTSLESEMKTFFADGIRRLVKCYTTCIKRGDYVEK